MRAVLSQLTQATRRGAAAALVLIAALLPAAAEIPGQGAAGFRTAVTLWLADDEAAALPELAQLAAGGNTSAQMMLALIDKTPALQGPWLARLPRAERIALMRAPGGMSGTSWMHAAAGAEPSAGLWLRLWNVSAPASLALDFARLGELRAARATLVTLAARDVRGFAGIADDPDYPASLLSLAWRESGVDPTAEAAFAALHPGDPQREAVTGARDAAARVDWLLSAPEAGAVAAFCAAQCPGSIGACALAVEDALGSARTLLVFGSPSERLIEAGVFHASPRGQAALLRRILLNVDARGRRSQAARAAEHDACFAARLEAEAQRYVIKRD